MVACSCYVKCFLYSPKKMLAFSEDTWKVLECDRLTGDRWAMTKCIHTTAEELVGVYMGALKMSCFKFSLFKRTLCVEFQVLRSLDSLYFAYQGLIFSPYQSFVQSKGPFREIRLYRN